ncbi:MAG: hypothetical protein AAFX87_18435 [Bacteroidota bacterium]
MSEEVRLSSSHLVIAPEIARQLFDDTNSAYISYKEDQHTLLISPATNSWFPKLHDACQCLLKDKDLAGTKSIVIRDMIIDHDLPDENRSLSFQINQDKRFMKVSI